MDSAVIDWRDYVRQWSELIDAEEDAAAMIAAPVSPEERGPTVMIFSPHPDDECLVGALPLRLQQECGARVINVAVTLGHAHQQDRRRRELETACRVLGVELVIPNRGNAFLDVHSDVRQRDPERWEGWCAEMAALLAQHRPDAVFAPHDEDFHPAHIATHGLVREALQWYLSGGAAEVAFFETEFWHEMATPNLLVGVREETEATILQATACHAGEVARNPYHLRHPARMIDNVRRGSEVVMGRGSPGRRFAFGELYRWQWVYADGQVATMPGSVLEPGTVIDRGWLQSP